MKMIKRNLSLTVLLGTFAASSGTAIAYDVRYADGDGERDNWMDHVRAQQSSGPLQSSVRGQHHGRPAPDAASERTVRIAPGARWANVTRGETVKFVSGEKSFTWRFDTLGAPSLNLADIAPKGFVTGNVRVYVARDDLPGD